MTRRFDETIILRLSESSANAFLSAENCTAYRFIMRLFYLEYQKMSYQLDKETIFAKLQRESGLASYTPEQLGRDLEQLTQWKNLTAIQDPRKVATCAVKSAYKL